MGGFFHTAGYESGLEPHPMSTSAWKASAAQGLGMGCLLCMCRLPQILAAGTGNKARVWRGQVSPELPLPLEGNKVHA